MTKVDTLYAKEHLAGLMDQALAGEEVVIVDSEDRQVRLIPLPETPSTALRKDRERLLEEIRRIQKEFSDLPDLDTRTPDEILGYDEQGGF